MSKDAYVAALEGAVARAGLANEELARRCGVSTGHMSKVRRGMVLPSEQLLERMADALSADPELLLSLYRAIRGQQAEKESDVATPSIALLQNDVEIVEYDETLHLDTDRIYCDEVRFVRATHTGVRAIKLSGHYPAKDDSSAPVVEIVGKEGCKVIHEQHLGGGTVTIATFANDLPVAPNPPHRFRIERHVVSGELVPVNVMTPSTRFGLIRQRVQFSPDRQPTIVQHIRGENRAALEAIVDGRTTLSPDEFGYLQFPDIKAPAPGLAYGFIWQF